MNSVSPADPTALRERRSRWPAGLVGTSAALFASATAQYPGGYSWLDQSISSLFQPETILGAPNPARPMGIVAVLAFCIGIGVVFNAVAARAATPFHRKTIQVAGIGSMVYAFLVVTPMHDVLVGVALAFFVVAMLTIFHLLWIESRVALLLTGLVCISGTLLNAAIYYLGSGVDFLPSVQKLSTVAWVVWLLALYYLPQRERSKGSVSVKSPGLDF